MSKRTLTQAALKEVLQNILRLSSLELIQANKIFYRKLTNGIEGMFGFNNESRGDKYFLIDFEIPLTTIS